VTSTATIPGAFCVRRELGAMGVTVELLLAHVDADGSALLDEAEEELDRLEHVFSRFLPDSELSALNRAGALDASGELFEVVSLAVAARERSGGRFDPTVHAAVAAAGYDRTFEEVARESPATARPAGARCGGRIRLDPSRRRIELEDGFLLDLGGIAKGWSADHVCGLLSRSGPCLVNAGGDLAVSGTFGGGPWPVAVDVPGTPVTLGLSAGGLATSGRDERRWRRGDTELHHLIDPSTGRPSRSDLVRVTAAAASAAAAEVAAKSLFLAGERAAVAEADALGIPCVLVTADDRVVLAGGLS
jgi:thiamine biosynthesis lipoprotein